MRFNRLWILTSVVVVFLLTILIISPAGTWHRMKDMPDSRSNHRLAELDGVIYVLGNQNTTRAFVLAYDIASGEWTRRADMITPRQQMAVAIVNGLIYCIGGNGPVGGVRGDHYVNEVYDPGSDTWTQLANMPSARKRVQAGVVDGVIYVVGGNVNPQSGGNVASKLCEAYDPATDTWTKKADMIHTQDWSDCNAIGDKIYVTGGWQGTTLQVYDTATDTWEKSRGLGRIVGNWGVSTTVHKGQIYIFGGTFQSQIGNAFMIYDPKTDKLVKNDKEDKQGIPYKTTTANAVTVDQKIYLMGGQGDTSSGSQVYVYDPLAAPPMNRFSAADSKKQDIAPDIDSKEKLVSTWGKLKESVE